MAIAPGFEHDLFVSYAHTDDLSSEGQPGWVAQFIKRLEPALRQRLGGTEALRIFFDSRATGANFRLPELLSAVKKSALFLAVGSPSYVARPWPRQELEAFVEQVPDLSRLFMIECLPLNESEHYPSPLAGHIRLEFWKAGGRRHIAMTLSPTNDAEEFQLLIHGLAADIRDKLLSLRLLSPSQSQPPSRTSPVVARTTNPEAGSPDAAHAGIRKTVLLAQSTDDVEDETDQLRRYLKQYDTEIAVLPPVGYPQGGEPFKAALGPDLAQADLFVQLLGRRAGRVPPDLPEGYTRWQFEAAKAAGVQIMQWRHPDLDTQAVNDPIYQGMLTGETVVASGLEAFKRQILGWARKPQPKQRLARSSTVFINADDKDLNIAKEVERECLRNALTTILPMAGPSSEATRNDLAENLTDCDVLVFIYGDTTQTWIRSQLRFFSKIKSKRQSEPKLLAICSGPPPKPDIGMSIPNAHVISCPDAWNLEPIRTLISEIGE